MTTFTQGPWKVHSEHGEIGNITNADGSIVVAQAQQVEPRSHEVRVANAYLIAAAPELLDLLDALECDINTLAYCYERKPDNFGRAVTVAKEDAERARVLIRKARGET